MLTRYESVESGWRPWSRANISSPKIEGLAGTLVYDTGFPFQSGNSREPGFESRRPHHFHYLQIRRIAHLVRICSQSI